MGIFSIINSIQSIQVISIYFIDFSSYLYYFFLSTNLGLNLLIGLAARLSGHYSRNRLNLHLG